jgi:putative transposase
MDAEHHRILGIKLMYARPYSPESKGKSEVFHHQVDRFLAEAKLENVTCWMS